MTGFRALVWVLLATPLTASLCGCAGSESESQTERQADSASRDEARAGSSERPEGASSALDSAAQGPLLSDVLALWESGNKDDAVEQLLSIRWDAPSLFDNMPIMGQSEKEFASLPDDERKRIQDEAMQLVGTSRSLARHAVSAGDSAQASGDAARAKAHYEAVLRLGQALSSPERLAVIQLSGKAMMGLAEKKLSATK